MFPTAESLVTKVLIHGHPGEKVSLELILRVVADVGLVNGLCAVGSWHVSFFLYPGCPSPGPARIHRRRQEESPAADSVMVGGRRSCARRSPAAGGGRSCARQPSPARIGGARRQRDDAGGGVGRILIL